MVQIHDRQKVVVQSWRAALKIVSLVSLFTFLGVSESRAEAQTQKSTQVAEGSAAQSTQSLALPDVGGSPPTGSFDCQKYDKYNTRIMSTIYLPSTCDTVSPNLLGLRDQLADAGWGIRGSFSPVVEYDIKNRYGSTTQKYAGQNLSGYAISTVYATYDLSRLGFPLGAQFTGSVSHIASSGGTGEAPNMGPTMTTLGIDVPLLDNAIEVKAGYLLTVQDFVGMNLTGNAGSVAQGLQSSIPALVGMSVYTPTPTAEITLKDPWTKSFYHHFAVARSISSSGAIIELEKNPGGFKWGTEGTNPLYINEVGYRTGLTHDSLPVWARAGFIYNTTDYTKFDGQTASNNYASYAGLTMQLTKNKNNPGGLNFDIKVDSAPSDRNIFAKDVAVNLFYVGPFENRPFDMISVGYSKTWESRELQSAVAASGVRNTSDVSTQEAISYSYRVMPGMYLISTASLVSNPGTVANEELPSALILNEKLIISF
ncbi:carbohydrate porin [Pseudomonas sp. FEN]|uniref:carbohydrate porin n=1 Tax=Pseudomonas sp. FEN TaxID=2767468 RepID=UPI00174CEFF9|nr:carbohydrate porin [Pseudomonas sp. FEN]